MLFPDPVSPATITTWFSPIAVSNSRRRSVIGRSAGYAIDPDVGGVVEDRTGVYLNWLQFGAWEILLVFMVTGIGAAAGLIPAVKGSLTQVADNIAQNY